MEFIFVPQFLALWHIAWGLGAAAHLSIQLPTNTNLMSSLLSLAPPPWAINLLFVSGIIAAGPALLAPVIRQTLQWNEGVSAWTQFDEFLELAGKRFASSTGNDLDPSVTVLNSIPESDALLEM